MKKYRFIGLLAALGLCQVCSAGLVAEWNFDDSGDLGKDSVGSENLTPYDTLDAATYDASGIVGGAARFGDNTGLTTPVDVFPQGAFTFAVFVKPDDINVNMVANTSRRYGGFDVYAGGTPNSWRTRTWDAEGEYYYRIGNAVTTEWTHLAITFDATGGPDASGNYTGTLRFYIDGEYITGVAASYAANDSSNMALHVGSTIYSQKFRGLMDEMKLYDEALSGSQIQQLANIPEPATMNLLFVLGLAFFFMRKARRK